MYYKNKDFKLYYEKIGAKQKNLIILPGWGNTRSTFNNIINNLKDKYTIYIFDYPGFGKSTFPNRDLTIYDYALLINDFIKSNNLEDISIIAHSFGGRITILLNSIHNLKINNLVLIDIAGIKHRKSLKQLIKQTTYKLLKKVKYLLNDNYKEKYQVWLLNKFSSADYKVLPPLMMKTFRNIINEDLKIYLKNIKVEETLIIWGEHDLDTPVKDTIILKNRIKNSEIITIPNTGHFCYLEQEQLIIAIIKSFLS